MEAQFVTQFQGNKYLLTFEWECDEDDFNVDMSTMSVTRSDDADEKELFVSGSSELVRHCMKEAEDYCYANWGDVLRGEL